ncbi:MAG TPA: ubiquinol-cytochrome C chaperone family protein [Acetobacteraceae bacterium]|nr:ubiquinol-cytochrome C chaperone family protein [Acetobacteraceae bacterium]
MLGLTNRRRYETGRAGNLLYGAAVAAAREPFLYTALSVPDTLDGRFDLVALHAFLLVHRLRDQTDLAQAVFDAMFVDMDNNLREIGVGDLSVGKRVRAMWEAFHGRSKTYETALEANDPDALAAALARNVWRGNAPPGAATALAGRVLAQAAHLKDQPLSAFTLGQARFLAP